MNQLKFPLRFRSIENGDAIIEAIRNINRELLETPESRQSRRATMLRTLRTSLFELYEKRNEADVLERFPYLTYLSVRRPE